MNVIRNIQYFFAINWNCLSTFNKYNFLHLKTNKNKVKFLQSLPVILVNSKIIQITKSCENLGQLKKSYFSS